MESLSTRLSAFCGNLMTVRSPGRATIAGFFENRPPQFAHVITRLSRKRVQGHQTRTQTTKSSSAASRSKAGLREEASQP
jgi:hypothetical protein